MEKKHPFSFLFLMERINNLILFMVFFISLEILGGNNCLFSFVW